MTAKELLKKLDIDGAELTTDGENIKVISQKGVITKDTLQKIKDHKHEIISYLQEKKIEVTNEDILKTEKKEYYPLSSTQRRLYYLYNLNPESTTYNMPQFFDLIEDISVSKIEEVLNKIVRRHESLSTYYRLLDKEPVQVIDSKFILKVEEKNIKAVDLEKTKNDLIRPFNLTQAPPVRAGVLLTNNGKRVVWIDIHHIACDGVSQSILFEEFTRLVSNPDLNPVKLQYKDYSNWQNSENYQSFIAKQRKYWSGRLKGELPVTELPADFVRNNDSYSVGASATFALPVDPLVRCCEDSKATLHMKCIAIFNILIWKLTGNDTLITGTPIDARPHTLLNKVIGMFVNMLPYRVSIDKDMEFNKFLISIRNNFINDLKNCEFPFEEIVKGLNINREVGRNPLFDIVISTYNRSDYSLETENIEIGDINFKENVPVKFDIVFKVVDQQDKLIFSLDYSKNLFSKDSIESFISYFISITNSISANPNIFLKDIKLISDNNLKELINLSENPKKYNNSSALIKQIEEAFEDSPDKIAVIHNSNFITNKMLNERSNQLSRLLLGKGVASGDIVTLMPRKSVEMIIAIIGILKTGACYLPIDPNSPDERINYILKDSNSSFLLSSSDIRLDKINIPNKIIIDDLEIYKGDSFNLANHSNSNDPAYVIYTSGTTGVPKGVIVNHKSLTNLCQWHNDFFEVSKNDNVAQYAGFGFDAAVWEIFPYLLNSSPIHIVSDHIRLDVNKLNKYFEKTCISIAFLPTQLCENFLNVKNKSLRVLLTGGDKLNIYKKNNFDLYNNYGPTENCVVSSCYLVDESHNNIPIGKPISNNSTYILEHKSLDLLPVGMPGELCVSGEGVARGYLNNVELTMDKFINNPLNEDERLYRTGDYARWLTDGNMEFLGRKDRQVKINGYRIELGEIENVIKEIREIKNAIVVLNRKQMEIIAYFVSDKEKLDIDYLLRQKLPSYMIPHSFIRIVSIPYKLNGKIDYEKLLLNKNSRIKPQEKPNSKTEKEMLEIWKRLLGREDIGVNDKFFEVGGDSIKTISLSTQIKEHFDITCDVSSIFQYPTIAALSNFINKLDKNDEVVETVVEDNASRLSRLNQRRKRSH